MIFGLFRKHQLNSLISDLALISVLRKLASSSESASGDNCS